MKEEEEEIQLLSQLTSFDDEEYGMSPGRFRIEHHSSNRTGLAHYIPNPLDVAPDNRRHAFCRFLGPPIQNSWPLCSTLPCCMTTIVSATGMGLGCNPLAMIMSTPKDRTMKRSFPRLPVITGPVLEVPA